MVSSLKYNSYSNIEVLFDVKKMHDYMNKADIAISSRGNVVYELCLSGVPTISISENENKEKHEFASEQNGFKYLGVNPSDEIIKNALDEYILSSKEYRSNIQNIYNAIDLRSGRRRVMKLINKL